MSIDGYIDYQRREFCKDVQCPVQMDLDSQPPGSDVYEKIGRLVRQIVDIPRINFTIG